MSVRDVIDAYLVSAIVGVTLPLFALVCGLVARNVGRCVLSVYVPLLSRGLAAHEATYVRNWFASWEWEIRAEQQNRGTMAAEFHILRRIVTAISAFKSIRMSARELSNAELVAETPRHEVPTAIRHQPTPLALRHPAMLTRVGESVRVAAWGLALLIDPDRSRTHLLVDRRQEYVLHRFAAATVLAMASIVAVAALAAGVAVLVG